MYSQNHLLLLFFGLLHLSLYSYHYSIEKYIPRLIAKGYKVAIAEQMTDPVP